MQFLNIPLPTSDNHLHCLISPRSHHYPTLHKHHAQKFQFKTYDQIQHPLSCTRIDTNQSNYHQYDQPHHNFNYLQTQSPYLYETRMTHSKSLNSIPNKFYSFKRIREDRVKQQNSIGKVIKAVKMKQRIKVISKLDQIKTIESQNSPRQSLNSQNNYKVEQSLIIMKGKDLYDDLMSGGTNQLLNSPSLSKSICYSPDNRKQLQQQSFSNRQNIRINIKNCDKSICETPTKLSFLKRAQTELNQTQNNLNNLDYRAYNNPQKQKNRLSFLKSRKQNYKN